MAGQAVQMGDFQHFFTAERWHQIGQSFGEHAFAGAGRAAEEDIMPAGRSDFQGAFGLCLADDVAEHDVLMALIDFFLDGLKNAVTGIRLFYFYTTREILMKSSESIDGQKRDVRYELRLLQIGFGNVKRIDAFGTAG